MDTEYLKPVFRWIHILWATIGCVFTVLLAIAKGHPPGLVFVPIVLVVWLTGHGLLWLTRKVAVKGKIVATKRHVAYRQWPVLLIVLVFFLGAVFVSVFFGLGWQIFSGSRWSIELLSVCAIWLIASLCFFGILLRKNWSRWLTGVGFLALALVMLYQLIESYSRGYGNSTGEWAAAVVVFVLLCLLGFHILRSLRIKAFFQPIS